MIIQKGKAQISDIYIWVRLLNRGKGSNEGFCHVGTRNSWEPLKKPKVLVHLKYMEP